MAEVDRARRLLLIAAFITFFDRALLPPLLTTVALDLNADLIAIGHALTAYTLAYGAIQLLWSIASSRIGRVRVLIFALGLTVAANLVSTFAVDPTMLFIGRAFAGAAFAAIVPTVLTYFGDTLPMGERSVATANLASALSLGMTAGTLAASVSGEWIGWRFAFAAAAAGAAVLLIPLLRLREQYQPPQAFGPALLRVLRNRWAMFVLGLGLVEGILLIGIFTFLPLSLQAGGSSLITSGATVALYGVAVIAWSQLAKRLLRVWPAWVFMLTGGIACVFAFGILVVNISVVSVAISAVLLAFTWALAHTQVQTWMTDAAADARAVGMSLFGLFLFGGGSIGAALGSALGAAGDFGLLFGIATAGSVVFTVAAATARARYRIREE